MAERTDEELIRAAGQGDRRAFGELVERHHRGVVQFVYRFVGGMDRDAAEDLAQDVFLRAWQGAPSFEPRAKVITWLLHIARNTCLNYRRRQRLRRTTPLDGPETSRNHGSLSESAEMVAASAETTGRVHSVLADLPAGQRAAIVLRHFHDLTYADIAEVLGISVSSVQSLLFRARQTLRVRLATISEIGEEPQVLGDIGV